MKLVLVVEVVAVLGGKVFRLDRTEDEWMIAGHSSLGIDRTVHAGLAQRKHIPKGTKLL
jgi:hypothetical protein